MLDGTYLSIRAFEKPFADYNAGFLDNPFVLKVIQKPFEGPPEGNYMDATVEAYQEISDAGRGKLIYSREKMTFWKRLPELSMRLRDAAWTWCWLLIRPRA